MKHFFFQKTKKVSYETETTLFLLKKKTLVTFSS